MKNKSVTRLTAIGIEFQDAVALRRISMTLHRWHELECGDGNNYGSWCITRGALKRERIKTEQGLNVRKDTFEYDDDGAAYYEHHHYLHGRGEDYVTYTAIPDRERAPASGLPRS